MAGEWLKFECSLPEKPETLAITVAMGWDDPDLTVGKLMRLFRWFDQQTVDGNAPSVTAALLDKLIGVTGFVQAVANAGWIVINEQGITLKNFDKHNGNTAKSRAQTAKRVANFRSDAPCNGECNATTVTEALAREEKRRIDTHTVSEKPEPKPRSKSKRASLSSLPVGFAISDRVRTWAEGHGHTRLDEHLESFISRAKAKNYTYADWDEAFMNAIREDWGHVNERAAERKRRVD